MRSGDLVSLLVWFPWSQAFMTVARFSYKLKMKSASFQSIPVSQILVKNSLCSWIWQKLFQDLQNRYFYQFPFCFSRSDVETKLSLPLLNPYWSLPIPSSIFFFNLFLIWLDLTQIAFDQHQFDIVEHVFWLYAYDFHTINVTRLNIYKYYVNRTNVETSENKFDYALCDVQYFYSLTNIFNASTQKKSKNIRKI